MCVCLCVYVLQSANQSRTFLSGNSSYMPLSCCCTWREAQSNTKHEEGGDGGERGRGEGEGGGLLASCRLNKRRVKEMEREAIFRDNLLFFMGCNWKGLNKGSKTQTRGSNIWQRWRIKVTESITFTWWLAWMYWIYSSGLRLRYIPSPHWKRFQFLFLSGDLG